MFQKNYKTCAARAEDFLNIYSSLFWKSSKISHIDIHTSKALSFFGDIFKSKLGAAH